MEQFGHFLFYFLRHLMLNSLLCLLIWCHLGISCRFFKLVIQFCVCIAGIVELFPCPEPTPQQLLAWKVAKGLIDTVPQPTLAQVSQMGEEKGSRERQVWVT
jgi:hypothetical protein